MGIKTGRLHGNGYRDTATFKITATHSKEYEDLYEYEQTQIRENLKLSGELRIYERAQDTEKWKTCVNEECGIHYEGNQMYYMDEQEDGTFTCKYCGLVRIPYKLWKEQEEIASDIFLYDERIDELYDEYDTCFEEMEDYKRVACSDCIHETENCSLQQVLECMREQAEEEEYYM